MQKLCDKHFCLKKTDFASSRVKRFTDVLDSGKKWVPRKACIAKFDFKKCKEKGLWKPSSKSTANYTFNFRVSCLPAWCQCAKVPKGCQCSFLHANVPINVPTCEKRVNYSTWYTKVPKACQIFNFACNMPKGELIFQLFFKRIFQFFSHVYICNWNVKTQNVEWSWIYFFIYLPDTPCVKRPI